MFEWVARHASQILLVVITAIIYRVLDYLFTKRSKVVWFYTNAAQFTVPGQGGANFVLYTYTLALQNLGFAPAEEVRAIHNYLPNLYQVYPPMNTRVDTLPGGQRALVIPRILPRQIVFVAYLDFVAFNPAMYSHIETKDHIANSMPIQFARLFPMWANWIFLVLMALGAGVVIFYLYSWGTKFLRLVGQ